MADAQKVKQLALECGFGLTGIAPAEPDSRDVESWKTWITENQHGEMKYMENPKKASMLQWWPQAKSLVMVGLFYEAQKNPGKPSEGRFASYSVYPEYQKHMGEMLGELLKRIQKEFPGAEGRFFADTSPVLERAYSRLSGMGWVGKNTMMIHPQMGSYFFLGGLALNLELEADTPIKDHCGTCTRCIDACPTEALTERKLDANRCIAYLTIEKRSISSSEELEKKTGNWVFGCDICQEVCPFNKKAIEARTEWAPTMANTMPLQTLLTWSEQDFKKYFQGMPALRSKWKGMLRNAIVSAANSGDQSFVPELARLAQHENTEIAELAARSLKRLDA